jgi:hypothetical protein
LYINTEIMSLKVNYTVNNTITWIFFIQNLNLFLIYDIQL